MSARIVVAYLLIAMLLAGGGLAVWSAIYNSERNVRRRERRARRERHKPGGEADR